MNLERYQNILVKRKSEQLGLISIITVYLFYKEEILIFERDDNKIGPISGKIERGESYADAAVRELIEETNIHLCPSQIYQTHHFFLAISPKRKIVFGKTLYATLCSNTFDRSQIRLNSELYDYEILSFEKAIRKISKYGHPESVDGIHCVLKQLANHGERLPLYNSRKLVEA